MNILARYTLKYLWLNKKRTGVTILGVILSSALICGVILLGISFQQMMIDGAIAGVGNFHAMFMSVPYEKAKYIAQNNAVETSMLKARQAGVISGFEDLSEPYVFLIGYDRQAFEDLPAELMTGRLPLDESEVAISQRIVIQSGQQLGAELQVGDQLTVTVGRRTAPDGTPLGLTNFLDEEEIFIPTRTATYTIVGILEPTFDESVLGYPPTALTYLNPGSLAGGDLVDVGIRARNPYSLFSTVKEITSNAGLTMMSMENTAPDATVVNYNDQLLQWIGVYDNANYLGFFLGVLGFMTTLVVAGSGLVIYNTFSISISERKKQFGMFASTGATAAQIHRAVMFEALVIGLAGIPLGILGGIVGVGITLAYAENIIRQLNDVDQAMRLIVSPPVIILTLLFTGATILLSAWLPARRAAKVSPIDAIRQAGDIQAGLPKTRRSGSLARKLFGFEGHLALKSIQRDRKRFRTTVFSLMISIILFVVFNAMKDYSNTTARLNNQAANYDLAIISFSRNAETERFFEEATQLPQVQAYSYKRCLTAERVYPREQLTDEAYRALSELDYLNPEEGGVSFYTKLCAFGQPEFDRYTQSLGLDAQTFADPNQLNAILVNRFQIRMNKLYEFDLLKASPGESFTFSYYPPGEGEGAEALQAPLKLAALAGAVPMGAYQPSSEAMLVVSDAVFDAILDRLKMPDGVYGELYFKTSDVVTFTSEIKQLYKARVGNDLFYSSPYEYNQREKMTETMVNLFFYGFLTLITLVGITNIVNTIDTNLHLRRREFAMLKSVGLTPQGFRKILQYESLFYGLTALLLGLPVSIALSVLLFMQYSGVTSFELTLPWRPMLICAIGVLLIVFVTMLAAGSRIDNDNIVDTIKEENL